MKFELYQPQAIYEMGQRKNQEDSIYPLKGEATQLSRVFIVCDGMGGHEQGEVASAAVRDALASGMEAVLKENGAVNDADFQQVLLQTYEALDRADESGAGRMGTTMTFLSFHRGGCLVAHIGDSRIYHLRPSTGEVLFRSRDHSLVQQLYETGEISYNAMATHPRKNMIMKAMQPGQPLPTLASLTHITDIRPDDYFYLCSDGMLEEMEDDELMAIVGGRATDEEKAARLVELTRNNADNHSAYLIHVKAVDREAGDEQWPEDESGARAENKVLHDDRKDAAWIFTPSAVQPSEAGVRRHSAASNLSGSKKSGWKRKFWIVMFCLLVIAVIVAFLMTINAEKSAKIDTEKTEIIDNPSDSDASTISVNNEDSEAL